MINKRNIKRGFTIIETLMAVLVLSLAMAGSLALAAHGLDVIVTARQQVAAGFLAQDAMEYIRSVRDTNCLSANQTGLCGGTWLNIGSNNLATLCGGSTGCSVDTTLDPATGVKACLNTGCTPLNYSDSATKYTYDSVNTKPTIYTRAVFVQTPIVGNSDEASTTVLVSWPGAGGVKHSVRIHDDIYNWQ